MPDQIMPQPEVINHDSWKLEKRRSCELVVTPSPCVKKALFHLERLKGMIKEFESLQLTLKTEGSGDLVADIPSRKKLIRFLTPTSIDISPAHSESVATSEGDLKVIGEELETWESPLTDETTETQSVESLLTRLQLTPQEVFNQVANLIIRLEDDRSSTERALAHERNRVKCLTIKIDDLSRRRLIELPAAVQREHSAFARDINELEWHVSFATRELDRRKEKLVAAEILNKSLREDIDFVKKHCPLVEEKLIIEKEAMKKIKEMQKTTDAELSAARKVQDAAELKYQEALAAAEKEREKTRKELEGVRYQLGMLKKDLNHSKAMHQAYLKKAEQSREKLGKQTEELTSLDRKIDEVREKEQNEFYKIEELRETLRQVEYETGEVTKQKETLENELEELHTTMKAKIEKLEATYKEDLRKLRELQEANRDIKFDIEDMKEEIKACDKAVLKAERELARYQKERERLEQQLKLATDDVANISMINIELKTQLEKEEAKSQTIEDALKETAENLRKQVNEEMRQRALLEAKRQQNAKALFKGKTENVKKKMVIEKTLEETIQAVTNVSNEVRRLTEEHEETMATIRELEEKLASVEAEHETVEADLRKKKEEIEPLEKKLQEEQMRLKEKTTEMEFEEEQMTRKLADMKITQGAMRKRYHVTEENIAKLKEQFEELTIQLECGEQTKKNLESQLEEASKRMNDREKQHDEVMKERDEVKATLQMRVDEELQKNKEIAQTYRELQSEHLELKNRLMTLYEMRVKMEISIKDHKQLLSLQEKLNHALGLYYHDRAMYNQAGLNKFHKRSNMSSDMMDDVQKGLDMAIDNISLFLNSQLDGTAISAVQQAAMKHLGTA